MTPWTILPTRLFCPWDSQARILEWVLIPFSRGPSWPRDWAQVSCIAGSFFTIWATREAPCWHTFKKKEKKTTSLMSFDRTMGYLNLQYPHPKKTCSIMQISKRKNRKDFEVLCFPLSLLPAFVTRRKPYRCINRFSSDMKYVTPIPLERQILL